MYLFILCDWAQRRNVFDALGLEGVGVRNPRMGVGDVRVLSHGGCLQIHGRFGFGRRVRYPARDCLVGLVFWGW